MTTRPLVCLLSRSSLFGWPPTTNASGRPNRPAGAEHVAYVPLVEALLSQHDSDLHFTAYSRPDVVHRLTDAAPERLADSGGVPMTLLVLEVDCPKNRRVDGRAADDWRAEERLKIDRLVADEPGVIVALSRGGYRLIGWLPEPHVIVDGATARTWSEFYVLAGADLWARYQIRTDPNCRDWQHLQRTPNALRGDEREPGIFYGAAPESVGDWELDRFDTTRADAAARELAEQHESWRRAVAFLDRVDTPQRQETTSERSVDDANILADYLRPSIAAIGPGGGRHNLYLALSGALLDRGFPRAELPRFIADLSASAGVDDARRVQDRYKAAESTIARASAGEPYSRIGTLAQFYPAVAQALDEVLPSPLPPGEEAIMRALCRPADDPTYVGPGLGEGSDLDVARVALAEIERQGTQVVFDRDEFWCYEAGLWRPGAARLIELEVHKLNGAPYGQKGRYKANQTRVVGAIKRAATLVASPGFFDAAPVGVAFRNGFLHLGDNGEVALVSPEEEHRALEALAFDYDEDTGCPSWERLLLEVFAPDDDGAEKAHLLQEFFGSCLLNLATRWQRCLVLEGATGDNGKSTILRIVQELFPESMRRSIPPQKWDSEYYVAKLSGCRFNSVAEMPKTDLDNTEVFKSVISGDRLTGRHPSGRPFDFHPTAGHAFACNELPGTSDQTEAYWKRFMPVVFNRRFTEAEQDKELAARIIEREMPGVAAWAVRGARSTIAHGGLCTPPSVARRKSEWRRTSDQVALFADERLELGGDRGTSAAAVYQAFATWSRDHGHKGMSATRFEARLASLGWRIDRDRSVWLCGLKGGTNTTTFGSPFHRR